MIDTRKILILHDSRYAVMIWWNRFLRVTNIFQKFFKFCKIYFIYGKVTFLLKREKEINILIERLEWNEKLIATHSIMMESTRKNETNY